jgi:hypothetical protein
MADEHNSLESMSCAELLKELARLTSERDQTSAAVATVEQAGDEQQVATLRQESARIDRIGELLKAKGCDDSVRSP